LVSAGSVDPSDHTDHLEAIILVWDLQTQQPPRQLGVPITDNRDITQGASLADIAFSPDGRLLITSDYNGPLRIWDVVTGKQVFAGSNSVAKAVAFSPDGTLIAECCDSSDDSTIHIWGIR
jgi:WD40 repeat protein